MYLLFLKIILERFKKERELPELDRIKFLVPQEINVSQFVTIIRCVFISNSRHLPLVIAIV